MSSLRTSKWRWSWLLALGLSCATGCSAGPSSGRKDAGLGTRLRLQYVGHPYSLRHHDANPGGAAPSAGLRGSGGRISGVVCAASVDYAVEHAGDRTTLFGTVDGQYPVSLTVADTQMEDGSVVRTIVGTIAYREVRVLLAESVMRGYVGRCPVNYDRRGDSFLRHVNAQGTRMQLELAGIRTLQRMPAADQAAVLPLVLMCQVEKAFQNFGRAEMDPLTFGGSEGAEPNSTLTFATRNNRDCGGRWNSNADD